MNTVFRVIMNGEELPTDMFVSPDGGRLAFEMKPETDWPLLFRGELSEYTRSFGRYPRRERFDSPVKALETDVDLFLFKTPVEGFEVLRGEPGTISEPEQIIMSDIRSLCIYRTLVYEGSAEPDMVYDVLGVGTRAGHRELVGNFRIITQDVPTSFPYDFTRDEMKLLALETIGMDISDARGLLADMNVCNDLRGGYIARMELVPKGAKFPGGTTVSEPYVVCMHENGVCGFTGNPVIDPDTVEAFREVVMKYGQRVEDTEK